MNYLAQFAQRKTQLWLLIILSAVTMMIPYYIQGALSAGKSPAEVGADVWLYDHRAWALRAIVEGLVIGYIARTNAKSKWQGFVLWVLELALILMIALTLGPVLYAALKSVAMVEALPDWAQVAWAFGLASYMPLMVLGASYAYKVQPEDEPAVATGGAEVAQLQGEVARLNNLLARAQDDAKQEREKVASFQAQAKKTQAEVARLTNELAATQEAIGALQAQAGAAQAWHILSATAKALWIAENCNGDRPAAEQLARVLDVNISTIYKAYKKADEGKAK